VRRKLQGQRATIQTHPGLLSRQRALDALDMALSWLMLPAPTPYLSTLDGCAPLKDGQHEPTSPRSRDCRSAGPSRTCDASHRIGMRLASHVTTCT
jgi:hypothetical protein